MKHRKPGSTRPARGRVRFPSDARLYRPASAALFLVWLLSSLSVAGYAYVDGPPPETAGGFGQDTCHTCHFENDLNDPAGSLTLDGVPETYRPGERYLLRVRVSRPDLGRGGFALAARFAGGHREGEQAGRFEVRDARVGITPAGDPPVEYAGHTAEGVEPQDGESVSWTLDWTAPAGGSSVVFHVSGNAANFDESAFGDFVYSRALVSEPSPQ